MTIQIKVRTPQEVIAEAPEPNEPVIKDFIAKWLWVVFAIIGVSSIPVGDLINVWNPEGPIEAVKTTALIITTLSGSLAAVLGLSRFAKTK